MLHDHRTECDGNKTTNDIHAHRDKSEDIHMLFIGGNLYIF